MTPSQQASALEALGRAATNAAYAVRRNEVTREQLDEAVLQHQASTVAKMEQMQVLVAAQAALNA